MIAQTKSLRAAHSLVAKLATGRQTLPILSTVMLSAKDGVLSLSTTDLDAFACSRCPCEGDLSGICVPAMAFGALLQSAGETVTLEIREGLRLGFNSTSKASLAGQDASAFPNLDDKDCKGVGLNCEDLATAIESVKWAAIGREDRPILKGICVRSSAKAITAMATDGYTTAYHQADSIAAQTEMLFLGSCAPLLCQALLQPSSELFMSPNIISITSDVFDVRCKQMEGKYYDLKTQIVDKPRKDVGGIDKAQWLDVLATVQLLARNNTLGFARTKLVFTRDEATISYEGENSFSESINGMFDPPSKPLFVNAALLEKALSSCNAPAPSLFTEDDERQIGLNTAGYVTFVVLLFGESPEKKG